MQKKAPKKATKLDSPLAKAPTTMFVEDKFIQRSKKTQAMFTQGELDDLESRLEDMHTNLRARPFWWTRGVETTVMQCNLPGDVRESALGVLNAINIMSS